MQTQEHFHEECGVFGIYSPQPTDARCVYFALHSLQHRGQESAGMAWSSGKSIQYKKNLGLVTEVFTSEDILPLSHAKIAIGHVRYSTSGTNTVVNAQPLFARYRAGEVAIAHNGNLLNIRTLRSLLENEGAVFQTQNDSEVFLHLLARYAHLPFHEAALATMRDIKGAYALVFMTPTRLAAMRDPYGYRPLCLGRRGDAYVVASETCALDAAGATFVRDIEPGELIIWENGSLKSYHLPKEPAGGMCIFEYVYLARPDSCIEGISVSAARYEAGRALAAVAPVEADMVAGVPDSALVSALGYAEASGIPFGDALVKNRYVGRTFIQPEQSLREISVKMKLNALAANVKGKRIVLIDDSIVRGTTSKNLVEQLKAAGATEVHLRISSPPVNFPCYFGINTPSRRQLISNRLSTEELCKRVGANSLYFLPLPELAKAVRGQTGVFFCTGCFSENYGMDIARCKRQGFAKENVRN